MKVNIGMRQVLGFDHLDIIYLVLKVPVLGKYAKNHAHIKHNQLLRSAALKGRTPLVNLLLTLPEVRNNANINSNEALYGAVKNGHTESIIALLSVNSVRESAHENNNKILRIAAKKGHFKALTILLWVDAVRENAHVKNNKALYHAAMNGHTDVMKPLLSVLAVSQNAHVDGNRILRKALKNGHPGVGFMLLRVPSVRENAHNNNNQLLYFAAKFGNAAVVHELLMIPAVRENAHANNNRALYIAIVKGHYEIVDALLKVKSVKESVHENNNEMLFLAARFKRFTILKSLLKIPHVWQALLSAPEKSILVLFQGSSPEVKHFLSENISLYGLPLSQLFAGVGFRSQIDHLIAYFYHPIPCLESKQFSKVVIEAVRILHAAQLVENYKRRQTERERNGVRFNNVDDEARIGTVTGHYHAVIKPYFKETFEKMGNDDNDRLFHIETSIREMLLKAIEQEAEDQNEGDIYFIRIKPFIDSLDEDQRQRLVRGNDSDLMSAARAVFCNLQSEAQTAWRAYDSNAVVRNMNDWPNLLTSPLINSDKSVYTVSTVGLQAPTIAMASDLAREMMAYSYLLVTDKNEGDDDVRMLRETTFIAKVAEIRRAHNNDFYGIDDPSCLPGTVSRIGDTWIAHSKSVIPDAPQLLVEELRSLVLAKFQETPAKQQKKLYNALVMLSDYNAVDIIAGKAEFSQEQLILRQQFKDSLGNYGALNQSLNQALQARGSRHLNDEEFTIFALALLANLGGRWIAPQLTNIYRKDKEVEIENPYTYFMDTQKHGNISKIQAMTLLREQLQDVDFDGKLSLIMQVSEKLVAGEYAMAIALLENKPIPSATLQHIKTYMHSNNEVTKEKAQLWEELNEAFKGFDMKDKGEVLREIVTKVIDDKQNVHAILERSYLPVARIFEMRRSSQSNRADPVETRLQNVSHIAKIRRRTPN